MSDETNPQSSAPRIGDTRPAPQGDTRPSPAPAGNSGASGQGSNNRNRRRRGGKGRPSGQGQGGQNNPQRRTDAPVEASAPDAAQRNDKSDTNRSSRRRRGGERKTRAQGRYLMCVHTTKDATHIATLEGRSMVEYTVAKAADEVSQIDGNIYVGRIQNVLPGMELAFVDIGIPKNAVLYRADIHRQDEDAETPSPKSDAKIEELIKSGQTIICQVTKNAIGAKGARLTQEVSLPGRFAVLVPNSSTIGIS